MSTLDPVKENCFRRDFGAAQQTVLHGISPGELPAPLQHGTSGLSSQQTWASTPFSKPSTTKYHSYYKSLPHKFIQEKGELAASGNPIRARLAEDYVRMVGQTFLHMGADDPCLNSACKIDFRISRAIARHYRMHITETHVIPISRTRLGHAGARGVRYSRSAPVSDLPARFDREAAVHHHGIGVTRGHGML